VAALFGEVGKPKTKWNLWCFALRNDRKKAI